MVILGSGRRLRALVAAFAVGILATVLCSASASAQPMAQHSGKACKFRGAVRVGHFSGIVRPVAVGSCAQTTSDAANGTPPLIWHGGPVMATPSTGPVVVTPIFWSPAGYSIGSSYKNIITTYVQDVAAASGQKTNVFSTLTEYSGSNGAIGYRVKLGAPINDTNPLPASGCILNSKDRTGIYADNSGYTACLDDSQVAGETASVVSAHGLPIDYGHMYILFLPKHVESCFYAGSTATGNNQCTINHQLSAAYCAYHNQASSGMVYSNMPYPVYASPVGYTCGSDARFPTVESPTGNPDADTEISALSHEVMESITDPDTVTGWFDSSGYENGDECAYVYGGTKGSTGKFYNQVINQHRYLTQEEFSNNDFAKTGLGCLQSE